MTDNLENTAESLQNKPRGKAFTKGFDPRRNIKGVPKDTLLMRKHMRAIAAELIGKDETEMTRLDAMLRMLWSSRNPAHNKLALQVFDPKLLIEQQEVNNTGITKVIFEYSENPTTTPPQSTGTGEGKQETP
jgi:hypothetical protein